MVRLEQLCRDDGAQKYQDAQFCFQSGQNDAFRFHRMTKSPTQEDERLNIDPVGAEEMIDELEMDVSWEVRGTYKVHFRADGREKELATNEEDDKPLCVAHAHFVGGGKGYCEVVRLIRKGNVTHPIKNEREIGWWRSC